MTSLNNVARSRSLELLRSGRAGRIHNPVLLFKVRFGVQGYSVSSGNLNLRLRVRVLT